MKSPPQQQQQQRQQSAGTLLTTRSCPSPISLEVTADADAVKGDDSDTKFFRAMSAASLSYPTTPRGDNASGGGDGGGGGGGGGQADAAATATATKGKEKERKEEKEEGKKGPSTGLLEVPHPKSTKKDHNFDFVKLTDEMHLFSAGKQLASYKSIRVQKQMRKLSRSAQERHDQLRNEFIETEKTYVHGLLVLKTVL